MGFKMMRRGVKEAAGETVLTPRFYTTDFEQMDTLLDPEKNPNLNMEEMEALLNEFKTDYNQRHFVRNKTFKEAAATVNPKITDLNSKGDLGDGADTEDLY